MTEKHGALVGLIALILSAWVMVTLILWWLP